MIAEKMKPFVQNNSAIRMMFEEGNRLRAKYGADKVYDFSLGNPSVPAPDCVREAIIDLVNNEEPTVLHGYMSNAGFEDVRETIAQSLNRRFGTAFSAHNLIMTVGAASGLNVILKTILNPGEEVIVFAPYFLEYGAYVRNYDGKLVEISPNTETFQPNLKELEEKIKETPNGKVVYENEAVSLELSLNAIEQKQNEYRDYMEKLMDKWTNVEMLVSTEQQTDSMKEATEEQMKILEVARRLMKGAKVPQADEMKLMKFDSGLYQVAKSIGAMVQKDKREEYDSLWEDEEDKETQARRSNDEKWNNKI